MKKPRRGLGRTLAFSLLGAVSGAGCGYAACVAVGIAMVVNGAVFFSAYPGDATRPTLGSLLLALIIGLFAVFLFALAGCVPGAVMGLFNALAFASCEKREVSAVIGAVVGVGFVYYFRAELTPESPLMLGYVLAFLAGGAAGLMHNLVLHRLENDE